MKGRIKMSKQSYTEILIEKAEDNAYSSLKEAFIDLLAEDLRMRIELP